MESVKIAPKKCKIAMALAGHHRSAFEHKEKKPGLNLTLG